MIGVLKYKLTNWEGSFSVNDGISNEIICGKTWINIGKAGWYGNDCGNKTKVTSDMSFGKISGDYPNYGFCRTCEDKIVVIGSYLTYIGVYFTCSIFVVTKLFQVKDSTG